jgi:DNA-binding transcriptional LysR family regulator
LESLESDALDLGVLFPPARLSARLQITHRFRDSFTFIAHAEKLSREGINLKNVAPAEISRWISRQPWLALSASTQTASRIEEWLKAQKIKVRPAMELDNFDLIINLVAVGLGVSLVPQRALALYNRRRSIVRLPWEDRFERELVVLIRQQRKTPEHIRGFVDQILF